MRGLQGEEEGGGVRCGPGAARTILFSECVLGSPRASQPLGTRLCLF